MQASEEKNGNVQTPRKGKKNGKFKKYVQKGFLSYDLMMIPGMLFLFVFNIIPMYGLIIAFQDFIPQKGLFNQEWVGFQNFIDLFDRPETLRVIGNTFSIALLKIVFTFPVPIIFALLMNEVRLSGLKKGIQTIVYLPNFISWVVMAGIILDMFSLETGVVNNLIELFGGKRIEFLGESKHFVPMLIYTEIWKGFGWGSIIYLASISNVDPTLYESCVIDGAKRWRQTLVVTLPAMIPIITLSAVLKLGDVLNAGFDQIFNLYNENVMSGADIIDTFTYRLFKDEYAWSQSTAIGLMKSFVSMVFILTGWWLAKKTTDYSVF